MAPPDAALRAASPQGASALGRPGGAHAHGRDAVRKVASAAAVAIVAASGEADGKLLQLAIEVRALQTRPFGHPAHVALLAPEQLLEIDPLERLARFPQRQLEEAGRDLGGHCLICRSRLAQEALYVLRREVTAPRIQREIGDYALQVIEIARPIGTREQVERGRLQRRESARRGML